LDKLLKIKETNQHGNSISMASGKICSLDNLMSLAGTNIMDCGQDKPSLYLPHTPDGFICPPILFHFTVLFQDCKVNSLDKLLHGLMTGKAHITIGFMKDQMLRAPGIYPKECGDGSNGKMEPTFCSLINLRQDGTTFQTVDLILNKTPDTENSTQNMFIITISILTLMKNQDKQEEPKDQMQINSFKKDNSLMNPDGDNSENIYFI